MMTIQQLFIAFFYHVLNLAVEYKPNDRLYANWLILSRGKTLDFETYEYRLYFGKQSFPISV